MDRAVLERWTRNPRLIDWIQEVVALTAPDAIHLCDGSVKEYRALCDLLVAKGTFVPLNPQLRPDSFLCRSDPTDVARIEEVTFICSNTQEEAGPTNHWRPPDEMKALLKKKFHGCMRGRTLYVIPFSMGLTGSAYSRLGVQITDSPYVVCNMRIMTRMGSHILPLLNEGSFVACLHSVGMPLLNGQNDIPWPSNKEKYIVHFPQDRSVWSFGSGYGGNALLGKKSFALRIASVMGKEEGWLAEHMLIMAVTNPSGKKYYIAAAFPSSCGKTNLALLTPTLPGWKVECVGDDIAWLHPDRQGQWWAMNPEAGFFGVAPGTSWQSNPHAMQAIAHNTLFTNVALTQQNDVWWEGMTAMPPAVLTDWTGQSWSPGCGRKAAHPNGRFTAPLEQCPILDSACQSPRGVPLSAILFGGRRASTLPLVYETFSWEQGVLAGAAVSSETTAAAQGALGQLRHDPFAMLPFCGYHMGDYFSHWLSFGQGAGRKGLPKIFHVNWFLKGKEGETLWPGFGENSRVLKWIVERLEGSAAAVRTPIGFVPTPDSLDLTGLSLDKEALQRLLSVDRNEWKKEIAQLRAYFSTWGARFPQALFLELTELEHRLSEP